MRVTSTINMTVKDAVVAVLLFSTTTVCAYTLWMMFHETARYIEQPFGAKASHRQSGLSFFKNITKHVEMKQKIKHRIIDPPVNYITKKLKDGGPLQSENKDFDLDKRNRDTPRDMHEEEYALRLVSRLTSYARSSYRIEGNQSSLKLGDDLHVTIQAKDSMGRDREEGGDFWFVTLATKYNHSGAAGQVRDYDNGTYTVYFKIGWPGVLDLDVTLIHPSQVATVLTNVIWNERDRVEWTGRFESPNGSFVSNHKCVLRRQYVPLVRECTIANPRAMGQTLLICDRPAGGAPCDGLSALYVNRTVTEKRVQHITRSYYNVFAGDHFKRRLLRGPRKVLIEDLPSDHKKLVEVHQHLPAPQPDLPKPPYGLGYWRSDIWHSLVFKTETAWAKPNETGECFRGKELYFLGDSIIRQWLEVLSDMMGVTFKRQNPGEKDNVHRSFDYFHTSMTYRSHPLFITSKIEGKLTNKLAFEIDVLNSLQNTDCNYIVVISSWLHFTQWTRESYVEHVGLLREAVLRLTARCPNVKVVVTGPHPREQPSKESRIYNNDLIAQRLGEILENAFSQTGALYLDVWDLNLGYPSSNNVYMPRAVVQGELSMFLSYVCGKKSTNNDTTDRTTSGKG